MCECTCVYVYERGIERRLAALDTEDALVSSFLQETSVSRYLCTQILLHLFVF